MSKNLRKISSDISFLINTAIASAKIKKLHVEEKGGMYRMRPSLHVILSAPVGQVKSTIMEQIAPVVNREIITESTRAGLVGSLDNKTYQMIPGAAWECRNSLLLMDEFTFGKKREGWEVFLQLLETQKWGKRIGVFSSDQHELDGDLYYKVSRGRIDMKTRFACIAATMKKFEFQSGQSFRAFVTRCVPYMFDLDEKDLEEIAEGKKVFKYCDLNPKEDVAISHKVYRRIMAHVRKGMLSCSVPWIKKELYLRSIGDLCRAYAVWGKNDNNFMHNIVRWKVATQMLVGKYFYGRRAKKRE